MPASCYPREFHPQLYFPASPPPVGSCRHSALPGGTSAGTGHFYFAWWDSGWGTVPGAF